MEVKSRVVRILKHLAQFHDATAAPLAADHSWSEVPLQTGEVYYGIYENAPGRSEEIIVITDRGLHLYRGGSWEYVGYEQIARANILSEKQEADELTLHLLNGRVFLLPVRGGQGRLRDAFEFLRFLNRVTSDLKNRSDA